jgi:hypothetical protein
MDALNAGKSILLTAVLVASLTPSARAQTTCYQTKFTIHCDNGLSASKEGRSTYWSDGVTERRDGRARVITAPDRRDDEFDRLRDQRK